MLIDRSHSRWALFSGISFIAGTVSYVAYAWSSREDPSGGTFMGLLYGVIGTAMLLFAGLLAARKPLRIRRIGSAQFWLKGHIWLGSLSIPFMLFHSGFGWGGFLEQCLWYSIVIVVSSGFFGLALQQVLPRLLWNRAPLETFEGQTPYQCDRMTLIADIRVADLCGTQLNVPTGHLTESWCELVREYDRIVNGPGVRNEQNARKLHLLHHVSPQDVRDFVWAMAKYAKSDEKLIRLELEFPELLAQTYVGLRDTGVETSTRSQTPQSPDQTADGVESTPALVSNSNNAASDLASGIPVSSVLADSNDAFPPKSPAAKGVSRTISPLELMKKKAEELAAQTSEVANSPRSTDVSVQSPTGPQVEPDAANPPKLSPLELIKAKAAAKAKAATGTAGAVPREALKVSEFQNTADAQSDVVKPGVPDALHLKKPMTASGQRPAGSGGVVASVAGNLELGSTRQFARTNVPAPPTPAERQLLQRFYLKHVRPFLSENRSSRSLRKSPLASTVEARRLFNEQEAILPALLHPLLKELADFCDTRRQIELQRRILRWMHWWLLLHVPASIALLILLLAHVVMAIRVVPFTI